MSVLAIIPTYNEIDNIERLAKEITRIPDIHVLFIDDNSPDGTGIAADRLSKENPAVKVIHRESKMGLGTAYLHGFQYALERNYEYIIQMDCDFSHDPADIPRFLDEMKKNCLDMVIGSRYVHGGKIEGWPFIRHLISKGGNLYAQFILGASIKDWTSGFKIYKSTALKTIVTHKNNIYAKGYAFQAEITYRAVKNGLKVREIPIIFKERANGESKMGKRIIVEAALIVLKIRWEGCRVRGIMNIIMKPFLRCIVALSSSKKT